MGTRLAGVAGMVTSHFPVAMAAVALKVAAPTVTVMLQCSRTWGTMSHSALPELASSETWK